MNDSLDGGRTAEMFDPIIPGDAGVTAEDKKAKHREQDKLRKRASRANQKRREEAFAMQSCEEWYQSNRQLLSPSELSEMEALNDDIRDIMESMRIITDINLDPELLTIVLDLVKERGTVHLGYISSSPLEIPRDWLSRKFWADPKLLALLEAENPQTATYVRYGLLSAPIDWKVEQFLTQKCGWTWKQAADLLGYVEDPETSYIVYPKVKSDV
jgi:hypothetical protein